MRIRRLVTLGAACAAALLIAGTASGAAPTDHFRPPADSLRALAGPTGMRMGAAATRSELATPQFAQIAGDQFNVMTPGNEMKWQLVEPTQGTYDWSGGDNLVNFARAHDQLVRGHTLTWHNQLPTWLTTGVSNGTITTDQLRALLHKHVTDEVTHFKGKIWQWDVANEFFTDSNPSQIDPNRFWAKNLGPGILEDVFRWAHAADPHVLLFYNDYNNGGEDGSNAKFNAVYAWAKQALADGVPLNGIGVQGHLDTQYGYSGTRLQQDLQAYADLGLKVAITEADVRTFVDGPTTQVPTDKLAQFAQPFEFDQMLKACLFVRQCISFTIWGISDATSWIPSVFKTEGYALPWDVNYQPKTAYTVLQQDLRLGSYAAPRRFGFDR